MTHSKPRPSARTGRTLMVRRPIRTITSNPNSGSWLVGCPNGERLHSWTRSTCWDVGQLQGHRGAVSAAVFLADSRRVVTGSEDTTMLGLDAVPFSAAAAGPGFTRKEARSIVGRVVRRRCGQGLSGHRNANAVTANHCLSQEAAPADGDAGRR